jgi:hypothetical protein
MFHWSIEAEICAKATERQVWQAWADVPSWPKWDDSLAWAKMDQPFATGATGSLKPKRGPSSAFTILSAEQERRFIAASHLPNTTLLFSHYVAPWWDNTVRIVHRVEARGFLAPFLWLFFGRKLRVELPKTLQNLSRQLESACK